MSEPVRQADDAGHQTGIVADLGTQFAHLRAQAHGGAIGESAGIGIGRMHQQMMARFSFHQARGIVHPGIVAARVATTDQAQRSRSGVRRDGAQALERGRTATRWRRGLGAAALVGAAVVPSSLAAVVPLLRRWFRQKVAPADLDDLVQDTVMAVHRRRASWDPARPFLPWLAAIARYRWVDGLRRASVRMSVSAWVGRTKGEPIIVSAAEKPEASR